MNDERAGAATLLAGRYELGSLLGHGGMGTVRDATDRRLGRPVAVKILRADLAEQAAARRRFETEAHAAARLTHPNVVMVFDSGEDGGIPFLVMERLPGRTLADELAAGPLSLERVGEVARGILAALAAAHAAGIIHRDIKPGNVLLTDDGNVKVSDFGIAKTVDDVDQTQTAELVATPGYLAPERLAGEPASTRSDLYSVGVLLYEALSSRRPFEGDTPLAVMHAIERGQAEPLSRQRRALPPEVVAVVERAMSLDPGRRFASAIEMAAALEPPTELDATVPIETGWDSETVPVDLPPRDGATRTMHLPSPEAGPSRGMAWLRSHVIAVGVALAVVLVVGIFASQQGGGHPATSVPSTTAGTTPAKPATTRLPAPLDDAIRRLEQTVAP
ncbi:MAG: eukaryotic-like serine/threonine-protein kinase [Actinomycetota bacterium]|nr:eukaryotic-like serine/threonine-protein kinase [Actinomycetota bacterium]